MSPTWCTFSTSTASPTAPSSHTPTIAQDTDGDGYVELAEGLTTYGGILLNLTTDHTNGTGGDNGHDHGGDLTGFPTAPDGNIWFVETYQLPAGSLTTDPMLDLREIVIHGESVPAGAGAGTPGKSARYRPGYKLVLPVASGELSDAGSYSDFTDFLQHTHFAQAALAAHASSWKYPQLLWLSDSRQSARGRLPSIVRDP